MLKQLSNLTTQKLTDSLDFHLFLVDCNILQALNFQVKVRSTGFKYIC